MHQIIPGSAGVCTRSAAHLISANPHYTPLQMCVYTGDREGKGGRKKSSPSELAARSRDVFFIPQVLDFGHIPAMKVGLLASAQEAQVKQHEPRQNE